MRWSCWRRVTKTSRLSRCGGEASRRRPNAGSDVSLAISLAYLPHATPCDRVSSMSASTTGPGLGRIGRPGKNEQGRGWRRWIPGIGMLQRYEAAWLRHDVTAGLVLTTMLVPVGVAYAQASGVPGIYGLYATIIPLLAYALFGPSRILVLG